MQTAAQHRLSLTKLLQASTHNASAALRTAGLQHLPVVWLSGSKCLKECRTAARSQHSSNLAASTKHGNTLKLPVSSRRVQASNLLRRRPNMQQLTPWQREPPVPSARRLNMTGWGGRRVSAIDADSQRLGRNHPFTKTAARKETAFPPARRIFNAGRAVSLCCMMPDDSHSALPAADDACARRVTPTPFHQQPSRDDILPFQTAKGGGSSFAQAHNLTWQIQPSVLHQPASLAGRLHEGFHQVGGSVALVVSACQQHLPGTVLKDGVRQSHGGTRQLWQPSWQGQQQQGEREDRGSAQEACTDAALQQRSRSDVKQLCMRTCSSQMRLCAACEDMSTCSLPALLVSTRVQSSSDKTTEPADGDLRTLRKLPTCTWKTPTPTMHWQAACV